MLEADPTTLSHRHIKQPSPLSENRGEAAVAAAGFVELVEPASTPWLGVQHGDGQFSDGHLERMEEEGDVANLTRVTSRGDECSEEVIRIYAMWCKMAYYNNCLLCRCKTRFILKQEGESRKEKIM